MDDRLISRYDEAVLILPHRLRNDARRANRLMRKCAEEFRLRIGRPLSVATPEGEEYLGENVISKKDIDILIEMATGASSYSSAEQIRSGYLTVRGGFRIGLCGSVIMKNDELWNFSSISSAAIRISKEIIGAADGIIFRLADKNRFGSTLIISPPGGGKTTLLRDLVRQLSDGDKKLGRKPYRISLADERNEISACVGGKSQMDVGRFTDIMEGCPKDLAITMMTRSMNPEVIALDEITAEADVKAIISAGNCGIKFIATAHADDLTDLQTRPMYKELLEHRIFENIVIIDGKGSKRQYRIMRGVAV